MKLKRALATLFVILGLVVTTGSNAGDNCLWNPVPDAVIGTCTWSGEYGLYCEYNVVPWENCTIGPPQQQ